MERRGKMSKKLLIRERIAITARGSRILEEYCPGLVKGKALMALVSSLQPFASIWFSAKIINEISSSRDIGKIIFYVASVILLNFTASLVKGFIDRLSSAKESQMFTFFGKVFADKQLSMDYVDLENPRIQHQRMKAEENLYMFGNGLAQLVWGTTGLVESVINITVSVAMMITLFTSKAGQAMIDSPIWVALLLLCIMIGGLSNSRAFIKENKVFEEWCKGTVWFNRMFMFYGRDLYMTIEKAKDLRIYEQNFIADRALLSLSKNKDEHGYILRMSAYRAIACTMIGISNTVGFLFVALKSLFGAFGVGSIVQYVGAFNKLGDGIQGLMFMLADNAVYCSHLQGLYDFLDIPNKKDQGALPVEIHRDGGHEIEFRKVSFQYPGSENYALKDLSLKFNVGQRMAVVGMNGSGKSTMIMLLCRLYEPTEGEITLNSIDIKQYDYTEYMGIFSVVFQDFKLFSFPLGQNVAASAQVDEKKATDSLRKAGLSARLSSMAKGLDTPLYKDFEADGVEISGGEAQKIALARALYKNAPFIILDEPTAALDPIAEFEVYSKFNEIAGDKTVIYISHRLSSCRFCDDIAVFHEGKLIQRGSHEALLSYKGGKYFELWNAQAQYYTVS